MIYGFEQYELDTSLYEFRVGGVTVPLEPKVFDVLVYLVKHRERVVTKEEFFEKLWPGQHITEATLNHAIMSARKATGDDGRNQRVIQTMRGRGYRFVLSLTSVHDDETELSAPSDTSLLPADHTDDAETLYPEPIAPVFPLTHVAAGERKPVTVLSCAVTNIGDLMAEFGADTVHVMLQQFFVLVEAELQRYDGTITHFLNGELLVLFGAPVAHEDHAWRAILGALGVQHGLTKWSLDLGLPPASAFAVRMGLHTGRVLVSSLGQGLRLTSTGIDGTTDVAIHCQRQARMGDIVVSEPMSRLVRSVVQLEPYVPVQEISERLPEPLEVALYRVVGRVSRYSELSKRLEYTMTQYVGRQRELSTLDALLEQVQEGYGHVVGIVGEPGMGKSRLLYEFYQRLDLGKVLYIEGHCLSYGSTTPYFAVLDVLRQVWGLAENDPPEVVITNVRAGFERARMSPDEGAMYLLRLLGVPDGQEALAQLSPDAIKAQTFATLRQLCFETSRQRPLILAVEDLHWIDATTEEFLASLIEYLPGTRIMVLTTYRPGYRPPWFDKSYMTQMALMQLTSNDSLQVVQAVLDQANFEHLLTQEILDKAAGNPLFLEELAQAVVEHRESPATLLVPDSIQALLTARIDRLSEVEKQLLQTAAVIGRDMPLPLLLAIVDLPEEVLMERLLALQTAEFLHEKRDSNERVYTFKHVLTQEVAYQTLIANTRSQLHQRIARVLETELADTVARQPELLAHHYTRAGLLAEAVAAWQRAGEQALSRSAYVECLAHAAEGLALIDQLPESPERLSQELNLHLMRASALQIQHGFGGKEAARAYHRADAVCRQLPPETPQHLAVLLGLWGVAITRAQHQEARRFSSQCLDLAQRFQRPGPLMRAHCAVGMTSFYMGDFSRCREHLGVVNDLYDPSRQRSHSDIHDPVVFSLANTGFALWFQGYPDQALVKSQEALARARKLRHPFTLAAALVHAAALHQYRREPSEVVALAEELLAMSRVKEFDFWYAAAQVFQGWGWLDADRMAQGIEGIEQGLSAYRATGTQLYLPYLLMLLAEGYGQTGHAEAALSVLTEALTLTENSGERWSAAELYRQRGELLCSLREPEAEQAESCYTQAISIARQQGAKTLELRATVSLGHLWRQQGKAVRIRDALIPLYDWFDEGHATADLQDAKAALDGV
ncbi:AAA family ATPase [Candidatus Entotheonella palauensis]|uniref:AAA family ATPase n=1 Tax=Candidatus Entotheonella palauensis TaxID=93172 RepID=UPI000B7D7A55|nr:AAA family ATPase [Candidatus Entotheonella palauensis]